MEALRADMSRAEMLGAEMLRVLWSGAEISAFAAASSTAQAAAQVASNVPGVYMRL